jgi:outer membrane protein
MQRTASFIFSVLVVFGLLVPAAAFAEPSAAKSLGLNDALAEAYRKNPDLEARRAALRSVDETYVQAQAGFRPQVDGVADYTSSRTGRLRANPKTLSLEMTQSLYQGGSTMADVAQSRNIIEGERARLQMTEQEVLLDGVRAYMNLIRDQEIVDLDLNNEKVLASHLDASNTRFKLGDITKTDVSQARSRLARATASRIAVEGDLKKSRAFFEKVVGLPPEGLEKPVTSLTFPATEEDALKLALEKNPSMTLAKYTEAAAKAATRSVEGENYPRLDLAGELGRVYDSASGSAGDGASRLIQLRATLPLYAGGATQSRIRQSRQLENQLHMETLSTERSVRQQVIEARESLAAAEAESTALQAQIDAAKVALEGVRIETNYGSRTTLDLLDAQQEYLDAQVAHVSAETNRLVAAYGLLAAMGGLTAEGLHLNVTIYNPAANFQNLRSMGFNGQFMGINK